MIICCNNVSNLDWSIIIPVLATTITISGSVILWWLNSKSNRHQEIYKRKEERYMKLIESLKGFYVNTNNKDSKSDFLLQLNYCWMYCPDNIILNAYSFLEMVSVNESKNYKDSDRENAVGKLILEIRKDLTRNKKLNTKLKPNDFKLLSAT